MRDSRRIRPYIYALALIALAAACVTSMLLAFGKARSEAVEQLFAQERILATQAVVGISDYFDFYERSLRFLASLGEVADSTETGKNVLRGFFDEQAPGIASVSRVDEGGILTFTYPFEGNAGRSILSQEHVRRFLETRRITLSGVFPSVQGFPSIALYVPVYRRGIFAGGLAILIPFKEISSRFVRKISIGRSGYALLVDKDGTELYSPAPDRVGKRIEESPRAPNAYLETARSMAAGREGRASYSYPTDTGSLPFTWRGYYLPVRLEDASWSILVTAPEAEAVSSLVDFRNFWFLALLLLAASFCLWAALMAAALKRLGASNSSLTKVNGDLERALSDIESTQSQLIASEKMAALGQVAASIAHQFATPLGAMTSSNENIIAVLGDDLPQTLKGFAALGPEDRGTFLSLVAKGRGGSASSARSADSRADRAMKLAARARLEELGASDPESTAEDLSDLGVLDDIPALAPLLATEAGRTMIGFARRLSSAFGSAHIIRRSAEKAAAVITSLRTYVRGDRSSAAATIDLGLELDLLIGLYVEGAHPEVEIRRRYSPGICVNGNPDRLAQVWVNIINNAVQAMEGRGLLEVAIESEGETAIVSIVDDGPGIPDAIQGRMFEPFFTTKAPGIGSGLGLDIARSIMAEHGGFLGFTSRPGRTSFIARLPRLRPDDAASQAASQPL